MNKLKFSTLFRMLTLLLCIINLPLYGMRSTSRVADIYSIQPAHTKRSCFAWLFCRRSAIVPVQHLSIHNTCEAPICHQLMNALKAGDIETVAEHLTADNVNLTIQTRDYSSEIHTANLLEIVLFWNTYTPISFKLQFIKLLIKTGFEYSLLDTILATDDIELVEQFIAMPEACRQSECNPHTPLALFMYQTGRSPRSCKRKTAHHAAVYYASNDTLNPELRARFALIAQTLAYQSLKEIVTSEDVKLLKNLECYYPEIVQEPIVIKSQNMSIADYAESLLSRHLIRSPTFTVLEDFLGHKLPPLPNSTDDKPASQQYHSDGNIHYHSKSIDLDMNVTPAPDNQTSLVAQPQDQTLLHISLEKPAQ